MKTGRSWIAKALAVVSIGGALIFAAGCGGGGSTGGTTGGTGATSSVEKGQALFQSSKAGCTNCHQVNGKGGSVGPDLSHIATTAAKRKAGTSAEDYIKESMASPTAFVAEGYQPMMPKSSLTDQELGDLAAYLLSLK